MAWRIVIEGEGDAPPSIKPWLRSVLQGEVTITIADVGVGPDPLAEPGGSAWINLLETIEDGD